MPDDKLTFRLGTYREPIRRVIDAAPRGSVVTVEPPRRTLAQNDLMWSLLTKLMLAKPEGRTLPIAFWKGLAMDLAGHKPIWERSLDGESMVCLGYKSSRLSKAEMSDVIEAIHSYAARHGIDLGDAQQEAA